MRVVCGGGPVLALAAALALPPRSRVALVQTEAEVAATSAAIYESGDPMYLNTQRPELLGEVSSHELLEADNRNGVLSPTLARDTSEQQFVFVDEPSCIGCRYCSELARSTFRMEEDFGAARVFQQVGDEAEVVEEARDCCPVDCIHTVSFAELRTLEAHRQAMVDSGAMAAAQGAGKLAGRAEGRGSRAPGWRDPLRGGVMDTNSLDELEVVAEPDAAVPPSDEALPLGLELGYDILSSLYPEDDFDAVVGDLEDVS